MITPNGTKNAVLSDLDGTILKTSMVLDHACFLHDNGIVNLGNLPDLWRKDVKDERYIGKLAERYRENITGMTVEDVFAKDFVKQKIAETDGFYSTLERLKDAKSAGSDVYLISGSPSFLLTPFARHFGFKSKGSLYERDKSGAFTGKVRGMFNADAKRKHISSLKVAQYHNVVAYGDTASDVPLFQVANHSVLVAPHQNTLKSVGSVDEIVYA